MKYVVGLKSELDLLNEDEAKQRYLEMVAAGYEEGDVFVGAPIVVASDVSFGSLQSDQSEDRTGAKDTDPEGTVVNPS
ncbi:Hypothetical protein DEACI_3688 [Acididesulfobacillus acetoxydans]|uniref:Uncharacterized protein n=1 Tax=Acididesulfobacillus acetoxydans TaxID=1561005 RepID=A0A8S0Y4C2_9FIRM|nr:hypothetical protein [Acididesulfobacillus acetoxydans]CAA7602865.1 Hypothetical protein DEACI_3688 [Acididesulfobacillus acetoxydans]CEJ05746.1 Hypothetical protein DEACI_0166 [Acididesulfobacillus acetoxydans]